MCDRKKNNRYISEDEYANRYMRQAIPYEGFVTGLGYSFFRYDTICPATCNIDGGMFWDRYTPTMLVQAIDTSDYMKERSWNVSIEKLTELLTRTNPDGTITVSLGINNEVTLSKEHGKCEIRIEDTGSEINVHVAVTDCKYENGVKTEEMAMSKSCRLKDFHTLFDAVSSPVFTQENTSQWGWEDSANFVLGTLSSYNTYKSGYFKYNELWHKTKTRGISWKPQAKWKNPGAKYWREQQIKPFKGIRSGIAGKALGTAGAIVIAVDVATSGAVKPSHVINSIVVGVSFTGWGSVVAAVWFVADFGTTGVNILLGNGVIGLGDMIDNWTTDGNPIIEFDPLIDLK